MITVNSDYHISKVFTSRKADVLEKLPTTQIVDNINEILNDDSIDLVVICSPNHTHYEQAKMSLNAGKHVVVEKPFVTSSKEGRELIELANKQKLILTVFHNRRWDCDFLTIKKLIKDEALGEIKQFESHFDRWRPTIRSNRWKEVPGNGSGIFFDLGVHLIDQCIELFGWPQAVFADLEDQKNNQGVNDYFHIILKYDKLRAILHGSSYSLCKMRFKVLGDKANYYKEGMDPQEERLSGGVSPVLESFGVEDDKNSGKLFYNSDTEIKERVLLSVSGEYRHFYTQLALAIKSNDPNEAPVYPQDALKTMKIMELATLSHKEGAWVAT